MLSMKTEARRISFLAIVVSLVILPACHSAGDPAPWTQTQPGGSSNVSYRPIFPLPRERVFYPSTYAAYDFGPTRPRKRAQNCPVPSYTAPATAPAPPTTPPQVTVSQGTWETQ
jgi:hypothetical protein